MKKKQIEVGKIYAMRVSGNVVPVTVVGIRTVSGYNGRGKTIYACVNQKTGRDCKAESAAKFRYEIKEKRPDPLSNGASVSLTEYCLPEIPERNEYHGV